MYASDPLAVPALWLVRKLTRARMIYHEHDAPSAHQARSWFMRMVLACRETLGTEVELCVIPQRHRLLDFLRVTRRTRPTICVWNCPRLSEIEENHSEQGNDLIIYYHGSINNARVPAELVVAASRFNGAVRLRIAGYETPGSIGHVQELMKLAAENGTPGLVEFLGTIPLRKDLLRSASKAHVGLSLMPRTSEDINLRHMVGASNKPFDCMACGLPLLVTDLSEWTSTFVEPGFARACDPSDVDSIEAQLRWYLDHPEERREMGRRCADQIRRSWNYDTMFADVLATIESH
jgi:glycosyltransferase involved in cell wall biosynthesis